ncbi:MAG: tRNA (adenosine(37)-N6)-threonylcarbamoyltransferase complex dimerization subunit type 1 TsaB [Lactovum sp.]
MKVLAFDSSAIATSVAVLSEGKLLGEVTLNSSMNHSVTLMPTIDYLITQLGLSSKELDRIVVSQGPGSYTGLRIAVTTAKTLAYTLKKELVGLSSLQAIALRVPKEEYVVSLMNARRGMVYAGLYKNGENILADRYISLLEFLELVSEFSPLTFTGELEDFKEIISKTFPKANQILRGPDNLPSAFEMGKYAENLKAVENIHEFNPIYLKKVEAEERWEASSGQLANDKDLVSFN